MCLSARVLAFAWRMIKSFVVTYKIRVPDRIEITEELLDDLFPEPLTWHNRVENEAKKNGGHLP